MNCDLNGCHEPQVVCLGKRGAAAEERAQECERQRENLGAKQRANRRMFFRETHTHTQAQLDGEFLGANKAAKFVHCSGTAKPNTKASGESRFEGWVVGQPPLRERGQRGHHLGEHTPGLSLFLVIIYYRYLGEDTPDDGAALPVLAPDAEDNHGPLQVRHHHQTA